MKFLSRLFKKEPAVTDEQILACVGHWMLCCSVGAYNKTLSTSGNLDFDTWFSCCKDTMVARVTRELGISEGTFKAVLLRYARANADRTYQEVFESEKLIHPDPEARRGPQSGSHS